MSDFEEIDKAAKALEAAKKKREQAQHQVIREENRLETEEKKQRSKRTHMLCFKAAHLAYSFDFTLQNELSMEENIEVAEKFIRENFTARGMICDVAIHSPGRGPDDNPNPHVHVLVPMRPLNPDGTWGIKQRREYILDEDGNRIRGADGKYLFNAVKTNDWGDPETLILWRENWAKAVNEAFDKKGITERVDARSYADQGIDKLPQVHEGPAVRAMEKKGIRTEKGDWNRFVNGINKTVSFILRIFKSIIDDIDEMKKQKADEAATKQEFFEAIEEYKKTVEAKYNNGKTKWETDFEPVPEQMKLPFDE